MKSIVDYTNKLKDYFATNSALMNEVATRVANGAHNLAKPSLGVGYTEVLSGATLLVNNDYSITLSSSSALTDSIDKNVVNVMLPAGQYRLSGTPSGGTQNTYHLWYGVRNSENTSYIETGRIFDDDVVITLPYKTYVRINIEYASGQTVGTKIFKPMIRLATDTDSTYQPYAKTNRELSYIGDTIVGTISSTSLNETGWKTIKTVDVSNGTYIVNWKGTINPVVTGGYHAIALGALYGESGISAVSGDILVLPSSWVLKDVTQIQFLAYGKSTSETISGSYSITRLL